MVVIEIDTWSPLGTIDIPGGAMPVFPNWYLLPHPFD